MMIDETEDVDEHQVSAGSLSNGSSSSPNGGGGGISGKRAAASPVLYKPGKRIRPPTTPPPPPVHSLEAVQMSKDSSNRRHPNKLKDKSRWKVKNRSENTVNGTPNSLNGSEDHGGRVERSSVEDSQGRSVDVNAFDEAEWKRKTDDLVHSICRVIRYPSALADVTVESMCNRIDGPCNHQISVIKFLISEAERFKQTTLAEKLKLRIVTLQKNSKTS